MIITSLKKVVGNFGTQLQCLKRNMTQRGFISIILIVLVLAGAVAGYIYFNQKIPSIFPSKPETSVTPTPIIPDEKANWKTYILPSNFEVKYPQTWDYYKYGFEIIDVTFGPKELIEENRKRLENPEIAALIGGKAWPVEINLLRGDLYLYSSNEVSFVSDSQKKVTSKEITINGLKAVRYTIEFNYDAPYISNGDVIEVVVVKKNSKSYSITLSDQKYKNYFDQILSSFKFIEEKTGEQKVFCTNPRPEVCTLECTANPPYLCGSDGKSYCSACQACSNVQVEWHVTRQEPCGN